jgi:hypothetical protein
MATSVETMPRIHSSFIIGFAASKTTPTTEKETGFFSLRAHTVGHSWKKTFQMAFSGIPLCSLMTTRF